MTVTFSLVDLDRSSLHVKMPPFSVTEGGVQLSDTVGFVAVVVAVVVVVLDVVDELLDELDELLDKPELDLPPPQEEISNAVRHTDATKTNRLIIDLFFSSSVQLNQPLWG